MGLFTGLEPYSGQDFPNVKANKRRAKGQGVCFGKKAPFVLKIEDSGDGQMCNKHVQMRGISWMLAPAKAQTASRSL